MIMMTIVAAALRINFIYSILLGLLSATESGACRPARKSMYFSGREHVCRWLARTKPSASFGWRLQLMIEQVGRSTNIDSPELERDSHAALEFGRRSNATNE